MKKTLSNLLHHLLTRLLWLVVKLLTSTYRFEYYKKENFEKARAQKAFVFAIWHETVICFMSSHAWTLPYLTLSSRSKDGDYAAFVATKMGFTAVRGSSKKRNVDKGGKEAIEEYIQGMNNGIPGGITVDGPKGPRNVCKIGVVKIAKETGCPILPGACRASRSWRFNSWDQFKIPKPFALITIKYGEPIFVNKDATDEEMAEICKLVDKTLLEL